jgi:hypothetical protein
MVKWRVNSKRQYVLNCGTGQVKKKKEKGKGVECNIFFRCGNPLTTRAHDEIQMGIPTTFILATQRCNTEKCVCVINAAWTTPLGLGREGNGRGKRKRGEELLGREWDYRNGKTII